MIITGFMATVSLILYLLNYNQITTLLICEYEAQSQLMSTRLISRNGLKLVGEGGGLGELQEEGTGREFLGSGC